MLTTLQTPRLTLRAFVPEDAGDVYDYAKNPNIGPPAGWPVHLTMDDSRKAVEVFIRAGNVWAVVLKETGRVIGSVGLQDDRRRTNPAARSIGYVIDERHWGRGLVPEAVSAVFRHAFEDLGVAIIGAVHYPFNTKSRRVMEKCGMRHEGTIRMATRRYDGQVFDDVCYSITRDEWLARAAQ